MHLSQFRIVRWLDVAAQSVFLVTLCAVLFVFDKGSVSPFILSKQSILALSGGVLVLLSLTRAVLVRKVGLVRVAFDKYIVVFLAALGISVIFSSDRMQSLLGSPHYFSTNLLFAVSAFVLFYHGVLYCRSRENWDRLLMVYVIATALAALPFILKSFFGFETLSRIVPGLWSSFDQSNSVFAVVLVSAIFAALAYLYVARPTIIKAVMCVSVLVHMLALLAINNGTMWWLLLGGVSLALIAGLAFIRSTRHSWLIGAFVIFASAAICVGFGVPKIIKQAAPLEVVLSRNASWHIVKSSALSHFKNAFVGAGPGSFGQLFSQFRDTSFNEDPYAWSLRFNQPNNTIHSLVADGGLVTAGAFIALISIVIWSLLRLATEYHRSLAEKTVIQFFEQSLVGSRAPYAPVIFVGGAWIVMTVAMLFVYFGPMLWLMWWVLLSLIASGVALQDAPISSDGYLIDDRSENSLAFAIGSVGIFALVVTIMVVTVRMFVAEHYFTRGLQATTPDNAITSLSSALLYRNRMPTYHTALAQAYLLAAMIEGKSEHPNVERVAGYMRQAVDEGRKATEIAPHSVLVWENLAAMYENTASLVPEARDWAIKSLYAAAELEPTNPVHIWRLGTNYVMSGKNEEGIKKFEQAIALKPDYTNAYSSLALAYEQLPDLDKAISVYETLLDLVPNDASVRYHFGRVLYNRNEKGDRDGAEKIWLAILEKMPNNSDCLYSLGTLYESRGQKNTALRYYNKVLELNPTNSEIKKKINALAK